MYDSYSVSLEAFLSWFSQWANGYSTVFEDDGTFTILVQCRVETENFEALWYNNKAYIVSLLYLPDGVIRKLRHRCDSYPEALLWVKYIADNTYPKEVIEECSIKDLKKEIQNSQN